MKKLLGLTLALVLVLSACGSSTMTFYGESAPSTEEGKEGEVSKVTYTKDGDDITSAEFDIVLADGSSKYQLSMDGGYGMYEKTGKHWYEHVDELDQYVVDYDKMPTLDADGKDADGASGATINLSSFDEAFNNAEAL